MGYPSQSTFYSRSYPDGHPSGSLLKDGDSSTMITRGSAYTSPLPDGYSSQSTIYSGSYLMATF